MTPEMETAVRYQSHLPALLACIAATDGAVLELGVGHFSTPQLDALLYSRFRTLVSAEDNEEWFKQFQKYHDPERHKVLFVDYKYALTLFSKEKWSVAFIDHSPGGENRAAAFKALIEVSEYVVMHDAQKDAENFQAVEPMLAGLNWHLCTDIFPHTLVASKTLQIPEQLTRLK